MPACRCQVAQVCLKSCQRKAHVSRPLSKKCQHIRGNFPAQVLGNLNELAWHFDAKRGAVTMSVTEYQFTYFGFL